MNFEVMKTPPKSVKRCKKKKVSCDDDQVNDFLAFDSSHFFYEAADVIDAESIVDSHINCSLQVERRIYAWLDQKEILKSFINEKKEVFFEASRERINSFSYRSQLPETDATEISPNHRSDLIPVSSNTLSPLSSKICQRRSIFSSLAFNQNHPVTPKIQKGVSSEQKSKLLELIVDIDSHSVDYKVVGKSPLKSPLKLLDA